MKVWLTPSVFGRNGNFSSGFQSFIDALSVKTLVLSVAIIVRLYFGKCADWLSRGLLPIDAAMTGWVSMANMGGSGDMLILAAGNRMDLMTYASISSRIGGAIVLAISGVVFGMFG